MAQQLDNIVSVFISRETAQIDTASFDIPAILATFTNFSERTRTYTSIEGVADDFASTTNVYKMASALFGQTLKPTSIVVGRRQVDGVAGSVATVANNTAYSVTINGTVFSFTSDADATAIEIVAGLKAAYDLAPISGITFTDNLDGTFDVAVVTPGTAWSIVVSANLTLVNDTPTETWTEALEAVEDSNNVWYALTCESHVKADILELAAAIQARRKIYGTSTQDTDVPTSAITDVATALSDANYDRTFIVYLPTADADYPECAWIGSQLPEVPGSNTWNFKSVSGPTVSSLTDTQIVNLRSKNCNFYTRVAGVEIFQDGVVSSSEFIDVMIFIDWVYARLQEAIFFRLINSKKIPYTRVGATIIENEIRTVLTQGVTNGGIAPNPAFTVEAPDPLAISPTLRAQRTMGDFRFNFRLASAVHKVIVRGIAAI